MTSHDEPNEWGFAGEGTAPQPAHDTPEEQDEDLAEETAVPGDDITAELTDALAEITDQDGAVEPDERGPRGQ